MAAVWAFIEDVIVYVVIAAVTIGVCAVIERIMHFNDY